MARQNAKIASKSRHSSTLAEKSLARESFPILVQMFLKQEAVFHSFRHLFITTILDSGVSPHMLAPIVGHEADLITGQVYWNKKDATKRQPTVELFKLPDDVRRLLPAVEDVTFSRQQQAAQD